MKKRLLLILPIIPIVPILLSTTSCAQKITFTKLFYNNTLNPEDQDMYNCFIEGTTSTISGGDFVFLCVTNNGKHPQRGGGNVENFTKDGGNNPTGNYIAMANVKVDFYNQKLYADNYKIYENEIYGQAKLSPTKPGGSATINDVWYATTKNFDKEEPMNTNFSPWRKISLTFEYTPDPIPMPV